MPGEPQHSHPTPPSWWSGVLPLVLAGLVGLITIDGTFVYDDRSALHKNVVVQGEVPLLEAFRRDTWGNPISQGATTYRPLTPLLWRALWWVGQGSPWPFRCASALLHVLATGMLVMLCRTLRLRPWTTMAGASIFAVHAAHAEAVGAIVGQADMLSSGLITAAAVVILRRPGLLGGLIGALLAMTACLVKESAFAPGLALTLAVAAMAGAVDGRRRFGAVTPLLAVLIGIVVVQACIPRAIGSHHWLNNIAYAAEGLDRVLLGLALVGRAVATAFIPVGLAPHHGYAAIDLSSLTLMPAAAGGILLLLAGTAAGVLALRRRNVSMVLALGTLFAPALMQSNLLLRIMTDFAERLLYPMVMSSSMLLAALLAHVSRSTLARHVSLAILLATLGIATWQAQRPWHASGPLWARAVKVEPLAHRARENLASHLQNAGQASAAAWHLIVHAHLLTSFPAPVEPGSIHELERLPLGERLLLAPMLLSPNDPCTFMGVALERVRLSMPPTAEHLRKSWLASYPACQKQPPR